MINVKLTRNVSTETENRHGSQTISNKTNRSTDLTEEKIMKIIYVIMLFAAIAAKLENYIDWTWWWVFSPLWLGAMIELVYLIVVKMFIADFMKDSH